MLHGGGQDARGRVRVRRTGRDLPGGHAGRTRRELFEWQTVIPVRDLATQIIEDLEDTRRGVYGGVVGYVDFAGNTDQAIAIRSAVIKDGTAYVQAGGGIVADSDPETEALESLNKATAPLRAALVAESLRDLLR